MPGVKPRHLFQQSNGVWGSGHKEGDKICMNQLNVVTSLHLKGKPYSQEELTLRLHGMLVTQEDEPGLGLPMKLARLQVLRSWRARQSCCLPALPTWPFSCTFSSRSHQGFNSASTTLWLEEKQWMLGLVGAEDGWQSTDSAQCLMLLEAVLKPC